MGPAQLPMLVGGHLHKHLPGQVGRLQVGPVGFGRKDTHGVGQADQPKDDGAGEEQDQQPALQILHCERGFQVGEGDGGEVDALGQAGNGDELLGRLLQRRMDSLAASRAVSSQKRSMAEG